MSPLEDYLRRMRAGPECQSARWTAAATDFPADPPLRPESAAVNLALRGVRIGRKSAHRFKRSTASPGVAAVLRTHGLQVFQVGATGRPPVSSSAQAELCEVDPEY